MSIEHVPSAQPRPIHPWTLESLLVLLLVLALTLITKTAYLDAPLIEDDRDHLGFVGMLRTGTWTPAKYLLHPINVHVVPAWRLWYYATWQASGVEPLGWHLSVLTGHAMSAWAIWFLLRTQLATRGAPLFAAVLWSSAAIGFWDNPLVWVAPSHLTFALMWWLLAAVCITQCNGRLAWLWAIACGLCTLFSVMTMGIALIFVPVLAWQYHSSRRAGSVGQRAWPWWVALTLPVAISAPLQVAVLRATPPPKLANPDIVFAGGKTLAQAIVALESLSFRMPGDIDGKVLIWCVALILVITTIALQTPLRHLRLLGGTWGCALAYLLIVHLGRSEIAFYAALSSGRYLYLPVLAWCVSLGIVLDGLFVHSQPMVRKMAIAVAILLSVANIPLQRIYATDSLSRFTARGETYRGEMLANEALLGRLSRYAQEQGFVLRAPDMIIADPPWLRNLSHYLAFRYPHGLAGLEVVSGERINPQDEQRLAAVLAADSDPLAKDWARYWSESAGPRTFLWELSARGEQTGTVVTLPSFSVDAGDYSLPLQKFIEITFPVGLPGIRVVTNDELERTDWSPTLQACAASSHPLAQIWGAAVRQLWAQQQGNLPRPKL